MQNKLQRRSTWMQWTLREAGTLLGGILLLGAGCAVILFGVPIVAALLLGN